jgi:hypothetical protein
LRDDYQQAHIDNRISVFSVLGLDTGVARGELSKARIFNFVVLTGVSLFCVVVLAVNIAVDPWGLVYESRPELEQPTEVKRFTVQNERVTHAYWIRQNTFDVLFVGSSRVRNFFSPGGDGMVPESSSALIYPGRQVFTAGISGSNMYVIRRMTEHTLALQELSDAFLLIDFVSMNDARPNGAGWKDERYLGGRIEDSPLSLFANYLSLHMFRASLKELMPEEGVNQDKLSYAKRTSEEWETKWSQHLGEFYRYDLYGCYTMSADKIEHLETTLSELSDASVKTVVAMPLIHYTLAEMIRETGNWENYKAFVRAVVMTAAKYDFPVWHFSPYGTIGDPNIRAYDFGANPEWADTLNFLDPGHVNLTLGNEIQKIIHGVKTERDDVPANLGTVLTLENVDAELQKLETERTVFVAQNPKYLKLVPRTEDPAKCQ